MTGNLIVHAISRDAVASEGLFSSISPVHREALLQKKRNVGNAIVTTDRIGRMVCHLILRRKHWNAPKEKDLQGTIQSLKNAVLQRNIKQILLPHQGFEKVIFSRVHALVEQIFSDTSVVIRTVPRLLP